MVEVGLAFWGQRDTHSTDKLVHDIRERLQIRAWFSDETPVCQHEDRHLLSQAADLLVGVVHENVARLEVAVVAVEQREHQHGLADGLEELLNHGMLISAPQLNRVRLPTDFLERHLLELHHLHKRRLESYHIIRLGEGGASWELELGDLLLKVVHSLEVFLLE